MAKCHVPACVGHAAQTTEEITCSRCHGVRWIPVPYRELDAQGDRTSKPPADLREPSGYTCLRCRMVQAGRLVANPLHPPATPAVRERLALARQRLPASILIGNEALKSLTALPDTPRAEKQSAGRSKPPVQQPKRSNTYAMTGPGGSAREGAA